MNKIIIALGTTTNGNFVYFVPGLKTTLSLSPRDHSEQRFISFAEEYEWVAELEFDYEYRRCLDLSSRITTVIWDNLSETLMGLCRKEGRFDPRGVCGRGLWPLSEQGYVYNTGDRLVRFDLNGTFVMECNYFDADVACERKHFVPSDATSVAPTNALSSDTCAQMSREFERFSFERAQLDPKILVGWMAVSSIFNLLSFRPHVAIEGERGSGKSMIFEQIASILGRENIVHSDAPTEPGLRQTLANDALPSILDEFETHKPASRGLFDFLRTASNGAAGSILKGTPGGAPLAYAARTTSLIGGITINFSSAADASRFAVIRLRSNQHGVRDEAATRKAFAPFAGSGPRLAKRMLEGFSRFEESRSTVRGCILQTCGDSRTADLYASCSATIRMRAARQSG